MGVDIPNASEVAPWDSGVRDPCSLADVLRSLTEDLEQLLCCESEELVRLPFVMPAGHDGFEVPNRFLHVQQTMQSPRVTAGRLHGGCPRPAA